MAKLATAVGTWSTDPTAPPAATEKAQVAIVTRLRVSACVRVQPLFSPPDNLDKVTP